MAPRVTVTDRGLAIGHGAGAVGLDLFAGAMHYWRVPRASWAACLSSLAGLGFRMVETYVPWGVHEKDQRGGWDFKSAQLDLGAFLDLAAEHGLRAIVRPGPHINAELTYFGFPERIVRDPAMLARSSGGTPVIMPAPPRMFPVPSYASSAFQRAACDWLRAVGDVVGPRLAPDGPVVAAQVDNELQMFFRVGAFDHDYHPDALAWWDEWSGGLEAPRGWTAGDAARCLRWVAFKDEYAARSLAWIAAAMRAAGFDGVPLFHNFPPTDPELVNLPGAEDAIGGMVGLDFYHRRVDYRRLRRRALYLAGTASTLPFAPEVGLGGPLWLPPMAPADQRNTIRGLLMNGVRAMNLFMAVERDRWYGAPIGVDGRERPEMADFVRRLLAVVNQTSWTRLRRRADVALLACRTHVRLATASSLADPVTPVVSELLPVAKELARDGRARSWRIAAAATQAALEASQVPYAIVDEAVAVDRLAAYGTAVVPTGELIDRALWGALHALGERGVRVVLTPVRPTCDQWGQPLGVAALPRGAVVAADVAALRAALPSPPSAWTPRGHEADAALYEDDGQPAVLFVGNGEERALTAEIVVPGAVTVEDCFRPAEIRSAGGVLSVPLDPHHVRMFTIR